MLAAILIHRLQEHKLLRPTFFYGGLLLAAGGTTLPVILPGLPSSVQSTAAPIGTWIINNQTLIIIIGLIMVLVSVFLP